MRDAGSASTACARRKVTNRGTPPNIQALAMLMQPVGWGKMQGLIFLGLFYSLVGLSIDMAYVNTYRLAFPNRRTKMVTLTSSEARANLYRLIDQAAESHQPIHISGKRTNAVLVAAEDWEAIQETLYLLSVPGMRESIKEGMAEPLGKSAKGLEW
jgi:prevent-host-death family protein